jgi:hypothetical protein
LIGPSPARTRRDRTGSGTQPAEGRLRARDESGPQDRSGSVAGARVRRDRIDGGEVTLRRRTRLHHEGVGYAHKGKRVNMSLYGRNVGVVTQGR